ncbi:ABC transporter permease [Planctomonas sp. JC2975]|uniref:ABC transporter permease n=1 Tax=Planctomonas sp. JC2975 TaxID=2729626 RepID=UPI001473EDA1|nr:ABC transporter permease [Planctomonas sp. JC2975]NNC10772.1 ABC transporter permease [Planctomonas sp. JC2975]
MTSLFGTILVESVVVVSGVVGATGADAASDKIGIGLSVVASVFLAVAVYVGCVVTINAFGAVIAGRRRSIALLRLVGAEGREVRRAVALEGLGAGVIGAVVGALVGLLVALLVVRSGIAGGWLPAADYSLDTPFAVLPAVVVVLTTWWAAWIGCRGVTTVSPLEATAVAAVQDAPRRRARIASAGMVALIVIGGMLLALGAFAGLISPAGLLIAFLGGVLSFTGIVLGAGRIMPPMLRVVGRLWRGGPAGRIAVAGVGRYPERSARSSIALVIGVTLVTTFAVALTGFRDAVTARFDHSSADLAMLDQSVTVALWVLTGLIGFSALIAGVGLVNTMLMGVLQRTRELGLLRSLGFSRGQLRGMIAIESGHVTITALLFGFVLGCIYGWAAAQSLMGSAVHGLIALDIPWSVVAVIAAGGIVLAALASAVAARRAVRVSPVDAMATE